MSSSGALGAALLAERMAGWVHLWRRCSPASNKLHARRVLDQVCPRRTCHFTNCRHAMAIRRPRTCVTHLHQTGQGGVLVLAREVASRDELHAMTRFCGVNYG